MSCGKGPNSQYKYNEGINTTTYLVEVVKLLWLNNAAHEGKALQMLALPKPHRKDIHLTGVTNQPRGNIHIYHTTTDHILSTTS